MLPVRQIKILKKYPFVVRCVPFLEELNYFKYRIAVKRIRSLRMLRSLYIGRVVHASLEQWKDDAMDLLRYNVMVQDDLARWRKE